MTDTNIKQKFPPIVPMDAVLVEEEEHEFEVIEYDDGGRSVKQQYVPDKAPVFEVRAVAGIVGGDEYTFQKGTDFDVIDDDGDGELDTIDFSIGGEQPDDNTTFYITYISQSVISRYVESFEEELDRFNNDIDHVIESHDVTEATGKDLDLIAAIFGELGRRRGRSDPAYRQFIQSIVQSFGGRGTTQGIKFAVSSALNIDQSEVGLQEDFQNNEYSVVLNNWPVHSGSVIEDMAELADPSGIEQYQTVYKVPEEEVEIGDSVSIIEGTAITDSVGSDDVVVVDGNTITASDSMLVDDTETVTTRAKNQFRWGEQATSPSQPSGDAWGGFQWDNADWTESPTLTATTSGDHWDFMQWTAIEALSRTLSDEMGADDLVAVDSNTTSVTDGTGSDETVVVDANTTAVTDSAGSSESVSVSTTAVAWGTNWETMHWGGPFGG